MSLFAAFSKNNSTIINGQILSSKVDMDNEKITRLADPTVNSDAVTKYYCDQNVSGFSTITVTLTSTSWTMILLNTSGSYDIIISNIIADGPCGKFTILKSGASRNASIQRWGSCSGTTTNERLEMRWLPNSGIELRKNGVNYDGTYRIRYTSS